MGLGGNWMQIVKAEIDIDGVVRLLEPLTVTKRSRASVTVFDDLWDSASGKGTASEVLEFLRSNRLPASSRLTPEMIERQIAEARDSWD